MRPFRNGNDNNRGRNYPTNEAPLLQNELQNLDMELQILKRQREIIFKQREVENQLFSQRLNTFNQPSTSSFGRPEPKQNYDSNYNASYSSSNNSKAYKRPSERGYDHPAPKQARSNNWGDNYKQPNRPQPRMPASTPQFKKGTKPFSTRPKPFEPREPNPSYRPQKDLNPNPPKTRTRTRNKIVAPVPKNTPPDYKKQTFTSDNVLRPGVVPSASLNGRLELALGALVKHIKNSQQLSEEQKKKMTFMGMRNVKSIIRRRISDIMMNKRVGPMENTVAQYRKKYPEDVDDEIIEAIEKSKVEEDKSAFVKNISGTEAGRIHRLFKSKINMLLKMKVQKIIDNVIKSYGDNEEEILKCIKDLPELEEEKETDEQNKDGATEDKVADGTADSDNKQENIPESEAVITENKEDVENGENKTNNDATQEINAEATEIIDENKPTDAENDGTETNSTAQTDDKQVETSDMKSKVAQYYKLMDMLIEQRLPKVLLRFKDDFTKMLYCEKDFIVRMEMIMRDLKVSLRKSLNAANNIDTDVEAGDTSTLKQTSDINDASENMDVDNQNKSDQEENKQNIVKPTPETTQKGSQLFVMLLGKPSLPPKAEIYDFLNKFNPKSIKKHKTVNNLLVVGFENKQDYDNILQANETKVGFATFIIKANEVIASDKQKEKTATDKNDSTVENSAIQNTEEKSNAVEEKVEENREIDQAQIDKEIEKNIIGETNEDNEGQVEESEGENAEIIKESPIQEAMNIDENSTEIINEGNEVPTEVSDVNNKETEIVDKNDEKNDLTGEKKESPDANDKVDGKIPENVKDTSEKVSENMDTDKASNLETIAETEEKDKEVKVRTRAAAVATPTRSSSRLANVTPSTIKTRRASRLAQ